MTDLKKYDIVLTVKIMVDLSLHITASYNRLQQADYSSEKILQPSSYSWPGDWEGRALLAHCHIYSLCGDGSRAKSVFSAIRNGVNSKNFFGKEFCKNLVSEQQLSGHSWFLRGLLEYHKLFKDEIALKMADDVFNNLYLQAFESYDRYPFNEKRELGNVSGNVGQIVNGWELSTDVGCAFMCIDGLTHYYEVTGNPNAAKMIEKLVSLFCSIDLVGSKVQTHATLSATRGIIRYYKSTGKTEYLDIAKRLFAFYVENGMTDTFENFNWFGRKDTWTEPCAVVDSLIVSLQLYQITGVRDYLTLSRRIWFNGLSFCHRGNGGAGPNSCVTKIQPQLGVFMFEAPFCCTMRYAEGLITVKNSYELYNYNGEEKTVDEKGRRFVGDILLVKDSDGKEVLLSNTAFTTDEGKKYYVYY